MLRVYYSTQLQTMLLAMALLIGHLVHGKTHVMFAKQQQQQHLLQQQQQHGGQQEGQQEGQELG